VIGKGVPKAMLRRLFVQTYPAPSSAKWTALVRNMAGICIGEEPPLAKPIAVSIQVTPGMTKAGKAKKRIGDLDNHVKGILDALNGLAFKDDSQVAELHAYMLPASDNPGVEVLIQEL
jgi:Holliday junction resolvase RusA-like endonuclease